jgi:tRNA threonylcarbamoyl adenosine modification protein (Sua5/YciO/YrdC/YwlC family)/tRNA threonylcarbamoyl adenosine modification protein YjeE
MEIIRIAEQSDWKSKVKSILLNGGIVAYPTDTCFALGALTNNGEAVSKLLEFKDRVVDRSVPIAVSNLEMLKKYLETTENIDSFVRNFTPGAVSIVAKSKGNVDKRLIAENGTLAVRVPNFSEILDLIEYIEEPITTTIASPGGFTPYSVQSIQERLTESKLSLIDAILDPGYELPHNPPSTVLDFSSEDLVVHRTGRINPTELRFITEYSSNSIEETMETGEKIISNIDSFSNNEYKVILLDGQMGAGKTHLTKGIALSLGIDRVVKSPTYNYINEYKLENLQGNPSVGKLIHIDAWRIKEVEDLNRLRINEYLVPGNVVVIEWGSVISSLDPKFFENIKYYLCEIVIEDVGRRFKLYAKD